ncbi:MAG: hypothetical protein RBU30_16860 [Polyangia bacterium]|jgi:hypothetical protein|nr:hypothetical protein [Polyangia bacterium]
MEGDTLQAELERIRRELERSRQRIGEAADGIGAIRTLLGDGHVHGRKAPPVSSQQAPGVVSNLPPSMLHGVSSAGATETDCSASRDPTDVADPPIPDAVSTARVPRPSGQTITGHGTDALDTASVDRPAAVDSARVTGRDSGENRGRTAGRTLLGAGTEGTETARVARPDVAAPGAQAAKAGPRSSEETTSGGDGPEEPFEEHATGEYQRPPRETLTYFFGVDGPAPDEETELGPIGGSGGQGRGRKDQK